MKNPTEDNGSASAKWMPCPKIYTEFPGLAYICTLDELIVVKRKDSLHDLIGKNSVAYTVFNKEGEKVFLAVQDKGFRKFDVKIFNYYGNEIIQVRKDYELCFKRIRVWAPPRNYVGSVEQVKCRRIFLVRNKMEKVVLKIKTRDLFRLVYYIFDGEVGDVFERDRKRGVVKVLGLRKCGLTFPMDISVGEKAVLLGACFLIGCLRY